MSLNTQSFSSSLRELEAYVKASSGCPPKLFTKRSYQKLLPKAKLRSVHAVIKATRNSGVNSLGGSSGR